VLRTSTATCRSDDPVPLLCDSPPKNLEFFFCCVPRAWADLAWALIADKNTKKTPKDNSSHSLMDSIHHWARTLDCGHPYMVQSPQCMCANQDQPYPMFFSNAWPPTQRCRECPTNAAHSRSPFVCNRPADVLFCMSNRTTVSCFDMLLCPIILQKGPT
jgi:hypothetical protein